MALGKLEPRLRRLGTPLEKPLGKGSATQFFDSHHMLNRCKVAAALCSRFDEINRPVSWGNRSPEKISFVATHNSMFEFIHALKEAP
jgi:hypothetical protein